MTSKKSLYDASPSVMRSVSKLYSRPAHSVRGFVAPIRSSKWKGGDTQLPMLSSPKPSAFSRSQLVILGISQAEIAPMGIATGPVDGSAAAVMPDTNAPSTTVLTSSGAELSCSQRLASMTKSCGGPLHRSLVPSALLLPSFISTTPSGLGILTDA